MEAVPGDQRVPAGGAGEALGRGGGGLGLSPVESQQHTDFSPAYLQVVHAALSSHHQITGRDGLSTERAGPTESKQPEGQVERGTGESLTIKDAPGLKI